MNTEIDVEQELPKYPQKVYDCIFRHGGNLLHTVPLTNLTKHELKLLAFIHGNDAIDTNSIKYRGERTVMMQIRAPEGYTNADGREVGGQEILVPVESEQQEYKRLAYKYDVLSDIDGVQRGRKYVEDCFKIRLEEFDDNMFAEIDPVAAVEAAAAAAEVKATKSAAEVAEERVNASQPKAPTIFARSASEGVRP